MPEKGGTYVFMCTDSGQNNGKIYFHNSRYLGDESWYESNENVNGVIEQYENAYENQDLSVRMDWKKLSP